jgi:hypothetical protein
MIEKLLATVAAITAILGREPDSVSEPGGMVWFKDGDPDKPVQVMIDYSGETCPVSFHPYELKFGVSKTAYYAVLGYCVANGVPHTNLDTYLAD